MKFIEVTKILWLFVVLLLYIQPLQADIIYESTIKSIIVPAASSNSNVVAITFSNTDSKCVNDRVKFDKNDKELFSYVLTLYASGAKASYYFNPAGTTLGGISGHNVGICELTNIWSVKP